MSVQGRTVRDVTFTFPVIDISGWDVVAPEVLGRNPKFWVREPGGDSDRQWDWLFKPVVVPPSTGFRQGEDWAEKIVCELGRLIGVPCAEVELAVHGDEFGCISRNVVPAGWSRVLGSVLLGTVIDGYRGTVVEHVNGREVPPHLRLLVRLDGHGPPGYQPMAGPDWETLAE
jgi:hypothetical protein